MLASLEDQMCGKPLKRLFGTENPSDLWENYEYTALDSMFGLAMHCRIDQIDNDKLICVGSSGYTISFVIQDNVVISASHTQYSEVGNSKYPYMSLHYKFGENKSFSYANVSVSYETVVGVSISSNPLTKEKLVGEDLTNQESNRPNIFQETLYFSINDIYAFDEIPEITRNSSGQLSLASTCSDLFTRRGAVKQCTTSCQDTSITYANGEQECRTTCLDTDFKLESDMLKCFSLPCHKFNPPLTQRQSGTKICVESCPEHLPFVKNHICTDVPPNFILDEGEISISDTNENYVDTCENGFRLEHPDLVHSDGSPKIYCRNTCDYSNYTSFYAGEDMKICVPSCSRRGVEREAPDEFAYYSDGECLEACPSNKKYISAVTNINQSNEYGVCVSECNPPKFAIIDPSKMYDLPGNPKKYYCVDSCSFLGFNKYFKEDGINKCTDECGLNSFEDIVPADLKYTYNGECLEECPEDHPFISEHGSFNSIFEYGNCKDSCSPEKFRINLIDKLYPSGREKLFCADACTHPGLTTYFTVDNIKYCTQTCAHQNSKAKIPDNLAYKSGSECLEECPESERFMLLGDNFNTPTEYGICRSTCQFFLLEDMEFTYPSGRIKLYCLSSCYISPYIKYYSQDYKRCVNDCREEHAINGMLPDRRYEVIESNGIQCSSSCPNNHVKDVTDFQTPKETAVCTEQCTETQIVVFYGYKFSNNLPKIYCLETCANEPFGMEYESSGSIRCTDSCIPEEASVPIPEDIRYNYKEDSRNKCVSKCPASHSFLKNPLNFNTSLEHGECVSTCEESNFQIVSADLTYFDSTPKKYCVTTCLQYDLPFLNTENGITYCVDSCLPAVTGNKTLIIEYQSGLNECVSECPSRMPLIEGNVCKTECSSDNPFIEDFKYCSPSCAELMYDNICVTDCESVDLAQFLIDNGKIFTSKTYVSSQKTCLETCSEKDFPFINPETNECVSSCPPECENEDCPFKNLILVDENNFCTEGCDDSSPFLDRTAMKCLEECTSARPFLFDNECLDRCPSSHRNVINKPTCEGATCDSDCTSFSKICTDECPKEYPLTFELDGVNQCFCECPLFYKEEEGECKFHCDSTLGFIPDETETSCIHCFKDNNESFFHENKCVSSCPSETAPNQNSVCTSCFDLDLWQNEEKVCIPLSKCNKLSHFDYDTKLCTFCKGEGNMLVKTGKTFTCEKTACESTEKQLGHFYSIKDSQICVYCSNSEFFEESDCKTSCSEGFKYDFYSKKCLSCKNTCSCCQNGSCSRTKCNCSPGWIGTYCEIPVELAHEVISFILVFMEKKLLQPYLQENENNLIIQVGILFQNQARRLAVKAIEIENFMSRIFELINRQHTKYAFQPDLLSTLDSLLQLALYYSTVTGNTNRLKQYLDFLYLNTNNIQLFNVTKSIIPSFTVISEGNFEGKSFDFSFGVDITKEMQLDLSSCLISAKEALKLPSEYKFPYRIVNLNLNQAKIEENVFIASTSPSTIMVSLYTPSGLINIEDYCNKGFVDLNFTVAIEDESTIQQINKLNAIEVNVFDKQDSFFNDRCVPFSEGKDVTISKRKEEMFIDPSTFCGESPRNVCTVKGIDPEGKITCSCKGIRKKNKSSLESAFSSYPKSNYILITCFGSFKKAVLDKNVGFYTILVPCILVVILIYFCNWKIDEDLTDTRRFQYMRTDIMMFEPCCMDITVYFTECNELEEKMTLLCLEQALENENKKEVNFDFTALPTLKDLSHLSFDESFLFDKRTDLQFANDILLYENNFFYTLFSKSTLRPKPFILLLFVTELNLNVSLNCFFIDDDLVDNFNETEDESFFSSAYNELPKTIWALLTAKLLTLLVHVFYCFSEKQSNLLKKRLVMTKDDSAVKAYNLFLIEHTCTLLLLILAVILLNLLCVYFVVIYNEIYVQSTELWLNGIFMGLFTDIVVMQGVVPVMLVVSRAIAIRYPRFKFLYRIARKASALKNLSFLEE